MTSEKRWRKSLMRGEQFLANPWRSLASDTMFHSPTQRATGQACCNLTGLEAGVAGELAASEQSGDTARTARGLLLSLTGTAVIPFSLHRTLMISSIPALHFAKYSCRSSITMSESQEGSKGPCRIGMSRPLISGDELCNVRTNVPYVFTFERVWYRWWVCQ